MRIGLTYDLQTDAADPRQLEFDPPETLDALEGALSRLGHAVARLGGAHGLLKAPWRLEHVDLVFNLAEGGHGRCREAWVPMLLEHWGVPFVGSGSVSQALGLDKAMSKRLAAASGASTPAWVAVTAGDALSLARAVELGFPLIVKPRYEGSGAGIDAGAIVRDADALRARLDLLARRFGPDAITERFIPFGELTVFLIGNAPPLALPPIQRPLDPATRLACHVSQARHWITPVDLTAVLEAEASRTAIAAFTALRCQDMARVDLRVDEQGRVYFLEINPLPSFDPEGSLGLLAEYLGTTYDALIGQVLAAAASRLGIPLFRPRAMELR